MTEQEWVSCTDPHAMLAFLRGKRSARKVRLYVCAYARIIWPHLPEEVLRRSVETGESYADAQASQEELDLARDAVWYKAWEDAGRPQDNARTTFPLALSAVQPQHRLRDGMAWEYGCGEAGFRQLSLIRCLFGNPFRPVFTDLVWPTPTVVQLAQAAYNERHLPEGSLDPACLAVLADALEENGCNNGEVLSHLRDPGPHVRGCWCLDLLLNKS